MDRIVGLQGSDHEIADIDGAERIDLAHQRDFDLGGVHVAPSLRKITGENGEVAVEPKVMQVLVALSDPIGTIQSRDDLIDRCWDGRIVGDNSINRVISLLRSALRETGGDTATVENVPKVGYRLLVKDTPDVQLPQYETDPRTARWPWLFAMAAAAVLALLGWLVLRPAGDMPPVSIAMIPFEAEEGTDRLFALGLTSEMQSEIAHHRGIEVTSSESARQLTEQNKTPGEVGKLLRSQYVLRGSVEAEVDRTVLRAELINSQSGESVWEETFASTVGNVEMLPVRAGRAVVTALGRSVTEPEDRAGLSDQDFAIYLTAMGMIKQRDGHARRAAVDILEPVVERNPGSARAIAGLAKAVYLDPFDHAEGQQVSMDRAEELAREALKRNPDSVEALKVAGILAKVDDERIRMLKRATELDPGDAEAWWWLSIVQRTGDRMAEGLESSRRVVLLDPLWVMAPAAASTVALSGRIDLAMELESEIAAAAVHQWQRDLSAARVAKMRGDLSEFLRLLDKASATMDSGMRRTHGSSLLVARILLGFETSRQHREVIDKLAIQLRNGILPTKAEFAAGGIDTERFWNDGSNFWLVSSLFLRDNREADLVSLYDGQFANIGEYKDMFDVSYQTNIRIPKLSLYLAEALERVGRLEDAQHHRVIAREAVQAWEDGEEPVVMTDMISATLAASQGDEEKAIRLLQRAVDGGWPYTIQSPHWLYTGPLARDPLWDELQDDPRVARILAPIKANLAQERQDALALGLD